MNIAMMTYQTQPRGGVVHASRLAEALSKQGVRVELFSLYNLKERKRGEEIGFYRPLGIPCNIYGYEPNSRGAISSVHQMISLYVKNMPVDFDLYHTHDCVGGNALRQLSGKWKLPASTIRTVHHIDSFGSKRLNEFQQKGIVHCHHTMVVSRYWQRYMKREFGIKAHLTFNGVDTKMFNPRVKGTKIREKHKLGDSPLVLFVGGLEPRKGLEYLIMAIEIVRRDVPDVRLLIVGKEAFSSTKGERNFFDHLVRRSRLERCVDFAHDIEESDLPGYYAACDVFALPSRMEGWGLSIMEAMACGKPVVATKVGGIPELVKNNSNGCLVNPGDTAALARRIIRLLKNRDDAEEMGREGIKKARTYSWDKTAKKVKGIYKDILDGK